MKLCIYSYTCTYSCTCTYVKFILMHYTTMSNATYRCYNTEGPLGEVAAACIDKANKRRQTTYATAVLWTLFSPIPRDVAFSTCTDDRAPAIPLTGVSEIVQSWPAEGWAR